VDGRCPPRRLASDPAPRIPGRPARHRRRVAAASRGHARIQRDTCPNVDGLSRACISAFGRYWIGRPIRAAGTSGGRPGERRVAWIASGGGPVSSGDGKTGNAIAGTGFNCEMATPGGRIGPIGSFTKSGSSRGRGSSTGTGSGEVPRRAAGGGAVHIAAGPAAITLPAGERLVQSGTLADHEASAGCGRTAASAIQASAIRCPTGGLPFGLFLIGRTTATRPPNSGCWCPRPRPTNKGRVGRTDRPGPATLPRAPARCSFRTPR
jgi:hypothetical protein